jgi:prepilin-type processing-associated H-X9-DG protein
MASEDYFISARRPPSTAYTALGTIHRGGANVLFCDGHVQWYAYDDISFPHEANSSQERYREISAMWDYAHRYGSN